MFKLVHQRSVAVFVTIIVSVSPCLSVSASLPVPTCPCLPPRLPVCLSVRLCVLCLSLVSSSSLYLSRSAAEPHPHRAARGKPLVVGHVRPRHPDGYLVNVRDWRCRVADILVEPRAATTGRWTKRQRPTNVEVERLWGGSSRRPLAESAPLISPYFEDDGGRKVSHLRRRRAGGRQVFSEKRPLDLPGVRQPSAEPSLRLGVAMVLWLLRAFDRAVD